MDNKENKKFKNVTITNQNRFNYVSSSASIFTETESIFNSTAKFPNDLISSDADISTISSITTCSPHFDFNNELVMTAANYKANSNAEFVPNSNDIQMLKQTEIDSLYLQYLMILTVKETTKKSFKDEEETILKDVVEFYKANEILKKTCFELEYEEAMIDNLLELVKFMDAINSWIDTNATDLQVFQKNYNKLFELCSRAKNFLKISHIHKPHDTDFEETVAAELNKTSLIIQQINTFFERTNFSLSPDLEDDTKIDSQLIEELTKQNKKLKDSILKYNALKAIEGLTN